MKKLCLSLLALVGSVASAEMCQITSPIPLPVVGSFTSSASTVTTNVVSSYTVVTSTYPINVSGSFAFTPPAVTTVTWIPSGAQPVTSTSVVITSTYPINVSGTFSSSPPAVTTVSWQNQGAQAVTSTSTVVTSTYSINTNLTNASVAVTGTFFQSVQPVSESGLFNVQNSSNQFVTTSSQTVITSTYSVNFNQTNNPATYTVTPGSGTFPVSWTVAGAQPVTSTSTVVTSTYSINTNVTNASLAVTGTFFQAVQPVSESGLFNVQNSSNQFVTTSSQTVITSTYSINVAAIPPTLTKGTQGSTGFSTQDLKDAGRTFVIFVATGVAGVTSEALFSFQLAKGATVVQSTNTYAVTAGKTLRLQGIYCSNRDGATAVSWSRVTIRWNPTGAAAATSVLLFGLEIGDQAALAGAGSDFEASFPDGLEIPSTTGSSIGVTHLDQATTNLVSCTLVGYEY